jgi:hypothetical protein
MWFTFIFYWDLFWNNSFSWSCLIISLSISWLSSLIFDEWRMLILDYRVTCVYSRLIKRRLWWNVIKFNKTSHQTHCERLIKLDEWKRHLIKSNESDSLNLTSASFHQIIKKRNSFFIFWWAILCNDTWCKELNLAENHLFMRK